MISGSVTGVCSLRSHTPESFPCLDVLLLRCVPPLHTCLGDPQVTEELQVCRFKRLCLDPTCQAAKTCCAIPSFYRHSIQKCVDRNLPYAQECFNTEDSCTAEVWEGHAVGLICRVLSGVEWFGGVWSGAYPKKEVRLGCLILANMRASFCKRSIFLLQPPRIHNNHWRSVPHYGSQCHIMALSATL